MFVVVSAVILVSVYRYFQYMFIMVPCRRNRLLLTNLIPSNFLARDMMWYRAIFSQTLYIFDSIKFFSQEQHTQNLGRVKKQGFLGIHC